MLSRRRLLGPGFQRAQPDPGHVCIRKHTGNQLFETAVYVVAIAAQMYTGQHYFLDACLRQLIDFGYDLRYRATVFITARQGNYAIGTAIPAAILHLYEGALAVAS